MKIYFDEKDVIRHTEQTIKNIFKQIIELKNIIDDMLIPANQNYVASYTDFILYGKNPNNNKILAQQKLEIVRRDFQEVLLISLPLDTLCSSIFQITKQIISVKFEKLIPKVGRMIGTQNLCPLIISARNQSMHWEEGEPKSKDTKASIDTFLKDFGERYDLKYFPHNLAYLIFKEINWNSYEDLISDLQIILNHES